MTVKTGQVWSGLIVCRDSVGALSAPSVGPAGTLYVDGVSNGTTVTVSGANPYKWTVTLPSLTAGQCVSMYITATISSVATASVVAEDLADTKRVSDLNDSAYAGGAVASVSGDVAGKVLGGGVSAITGVGVWSDLRSILGTLMTETVGGYIAAAFKKLFNVATPLLVASDAMRGTDGAYTGTPPTVVQIDTQLSGTHGAGAWGSGTGASSKTYTVTVDGSAGTGVYVRMTTDAAGTNNVDAGTTNAAGTVTLHHDLAVGTTVYLWRSKDGVEFTDPDIEVI